MKRTLLLIIYAALLLGCSPTETQAAYEEDPHLQPPAQTESDVFALNMFRALVNERHGNIIFSPSATEALLHMLMQGARGKTAAELVALPMGQTEATTAMQVAEASALFLDTTFRLKPGITADTVISAPLTPQPTEAARQINTWAAQNTRGMIPEIITPNELKKGEPIRLIATSAIALEEKWLRPFHPDATDTDAVFTGADGRKISVAMMYRTCKYRYAEGRDWRAVALFYRTDGRKGEPGCFLAILPKGDARAFAGTLTARTFSSIRNALATAPPREITIGLPKIEQRTPAFSLTTALQACGLRHIFTSGADLSGFADEDLHLQNVLHRCYVKADEQGVRAAAVAGGVVVEKCADISLPPLIFNRPFVWAITDLTTPTAPYFLGLFESP